MAGNESGAAKRLEIWSDGACKFNPGPGGWGARLIYGPHVKDLYGGDLNTTNNRMELSAVIAALACLKRPCPILLYTDSQYVKNGVTQWMAGWKARGWKKAGARPVKNVHLWKKLDELVSAHEIEWRWVKGHAGVDNNEVADQLANRGVDEVMGRCPPCAALPEDVRSMLRGCLDKKDEDETDLFGH